MFQLDQSALLRSDFNPLVKAVEARESVDARNLTFSPGQIEAIRSALSIDEEGRAQFIRWRFEGAEFPDGCDFSQSAFLGTAFNNCTFGDRVSFRKSTFTRALFRGADFGDDVNLERTDFGVKADFHSARFGDRARFSHSRFSSLQFFSVVFGSEAGFARVTFASSARFHGARFGARANFTESRFAAYADFGGAHFGDKFQMVKVSFMASPFFVGASFGARARLTHWHVGGDLNMRSTHFLGDVSLHGADVEGDAILKNASFDGLVDVGSVNIGGSAYFGSISLNLADRFGPLRAAGRIDLRAAIVRSPCALNVSGSEVELSDIRFLAPARITIGSGEVFLERLESDSRLVVTTPEPVGVRYPPPRLLSVRAADLAGVLISGLDVRALRFEGAEGIDGLRIESGATFADAPRGPRTHREAIAEEHAMRAGQCCGDDWYPKECQSRSGLSHSRVGRAELARIYRGLRKAREDARDAPGAADFYYGEMEMRRLEARARLSQWHGFGPLALHAGTYLLLELYRIFGGYGVRPSRPLLLFVALAVAAAACVDCGNLLHQAALSAGDETRQVVAPADFEQSLVFVLRSALLLPTGTAVVAAVGAEWIQIAARVLGPLLIGLFAFGTRARVHR